MAVCRRWHIFFNTTKVFNKLFKTLEKSEDPSEKENVINKTVGPDGYKTYNNDALVDKNPDVKAIIIVKEVEPSS